MVYETIYKDQKAVTVENEALRFLFLPDTGASIASILWKSENKEMLIQRPGPNYRRVAFDGSYVDAECSGMDDMFPTIDACHYERFPWNGVRLADHGEVWNLSCNTELTSTSASFTVHGVRLPYIFSKKAEFRDDFTLRLEYNVENPTPFDMDFIWAGHIMLRAEPGVQLQVPEGCKAAQAVFSNTGWIGAYADEFSYPAFEDARGVLRDMSRMGEADGSCEKFYFKEKLIKGGCSVSYPDGLRINIGFPADRVPYLGILRNLGGFMSIYNLFVEPCTAPFDRPDIARQMGKCSVIPAHSSYGWHLDFSVTKP